MFYSLFWLIICLIGNPIYSKKSILESCFNSINIRLEKNKDMNLFIKKLVSKDNIFSYFGVNGNFKIYGNTATFSIKNGKFVLNFHTDKKNIFQIIGDQIQCSYKDLFIFSNKVDAYIDIDNYENIDVTFENNYKLIYKDFQFGSYRRLFYRKNILTGNKLWGNNFNLNISITIDVLKANLYEQKGTLYNVCIKNPAMNLLIEIDNISIEKQHVTGNTAKLSINGKKFYLKKIVPTQDYLLINDIRLENNLMEFNSPKATIILKNNSLIIEDIIVKKKNLILKIKKCVISLSNTDIALLSDIQVFSNEKLVSTNISGQFDFKSNLLTLVDGKIHLKNSS